MIRAATWKRLNKSWRYPCIWRAMFQKRENKRERQYVRSIYKAVKKRRQRSIQTHPTFFSFFLEFLMF
ncbi:hypothetical protein GE21DRAFT_1186887, partial [Neurospora crassa]